MEIERKFRMTSLPENWESFPSSLIEQAYISRDPVIRVRRRDDRYILTVKGGGLMARQEFELPLTKESYEHLKEKAEGNLIRKRRVLIPLPPYTVEMDIFEEPFHDMILAEVEFPTIEEAEAFTAPAWLGQDVTSDTRYHNSVMSASRYTDGRFFSGQPDSGSSSAG